MARLEQHSGPLPSPETLRAYAELIPEGGDRLMKMVESEAAHRHTIEAEREKRATLGVVLGFSVALAGFGVSAYGFFLGHAAEAALVAGATLATLAGTFVYGTATTKAERRSERDD